MALPWWRMAVGRFDVVHAVEEAAHLAAPLARLLRLPLVVDVDSSIPAQMRESGFAPRGPLLWAAEVHRLIQKASVWGLNQESAGFDWSAVMARKDALIKEFNDFTGKDYDAVIIAVNHGKYNDLDEAYFKSITTPRAIVVDVKGTFRNKIKELKYWSL